MYQLTKDEHVKLPSRHRRGSRPRTKDACDAMRENSLFGLDHPVHQQLVTGALRDGPGHPG